MDGIAISNLSAISPTVIGPPARWLRIRRRGVEASALNALSIDTFLIRKIGKSSEPAPAPTGGPDCAGIPLRYRIIAACMDGLVHRTDRPGPDEGGGDGAVREAQDG